MNKGYKKNININPLKIGPEKRQEILDDIDYKGTYLPKSVHYEDIDKSFLEFVDEILEVEIQGVKVKVIFLTIQRWAEFSKTWTFSDEFKNITMPFITVVRQPDVQVGTNQNGLWNIPGRKLYTYMKVPSFDGSRKGQDLYKIPQPTSVDIIYEVRFFCNRMRDLNIFNELAQLTFQSRQYYIKIKGHPMPIHLESIGDESQVDDFDSRRFYVQNFEMKVLAYILDEEDFEHIPTFNRVILFNEILDTKLKPKITISSLADIDEITLNIIVKANHFGTEFRIDMNYDVEFTNVDIIKNVNSVVFSINGIQQNLPFSINSNETLTMAIDRDETKEAKLILSGTIK